VLITPSGEVWAGDGPIFNTSCTPSSGITPGNGNARYSQVVVFDSTGALKTTISTGGIRRADELCYNARFNTLLVANDDPLDNFITLIDVATDKVQQKIYFNGKDANGANILANGIEQCQYNPRNGKFYLNIPAQGTDANPDRGSSS
jgi:hypothetical protein